MISAGKTMQEDPPGMTALSLRPFHTPPHSSIRSLKGIPIGNSRLPGFSTWPETEKITVPPEFTMGIPFKDLMELCGGVWKGRKLKAVIPGGSSCMVVPAEIMWNTNMDYDSLKKAGSSFGTGAVIVMDETTCMVRALERLARFYMSESWPVHALPGRHGLAGPHVEADHRRR